MIGKTKMLLVIFAILKIVLLIVLLPEAQTRLQVQRWTVDHSKELTEAIKRYEIVTSSPELGTSYTDVATGAALQDIEQGTENVSWTDVQFEYSKVISYTGETAYVEVIYHIEGVLHHNTGEEEKVGHDYWTIYYLIWEDGKWKVAYSPGVCPPPNLGWKADDCVNSVQCYPIRVR